MDKKDKIYIAGHQGLVGSAMVKRLRKEGMKNIITRSSSELDLTDQQAVRSFFASQRPDYVFLFAGKTGGILANEAQPVEYIYPNLLIECNVISSAWEEGAKKLLFLACGCVYPKECAQPMKEEFLLTGKPEPTNLAHSLAKISGIVMCQSFNKQYNTNFISCISANIFGSNDNFDLKSAHVIPALINKFHLAKTSNQPTVTIWGTGKCRRDFIYVEDVVGACLFLMDSYDSSEIINIGAGIDITIAELADLIRDVVGYKGKIVYDSSKPDGMPSKLLDNTLIASLGWKARSSLRKGLIETYRGYLNSIT